MTELDLSSPDFDLKAEIDRRVQDEMDRLMAEWDEAHFFRGNGPPVRCLYCDREDPPCHFVPIFMSTTDKNGRWKDGGCCWDCDKSIRAAVAARQARIDQDKAAP